MKHLRNCVECGSTEICFEVQPGYWLCPGCEGAFDNTPILEAAMYPCDPTPDEVKTFICGKLRSAEEELKQAIRGIASLPSMTEHAGPTTDALRLVKAIADAINPYA